MKAQNDFLLSPPARRRTGRMAQNLNVFLRYDGSTPYEIFSVVNNGKGRTSNLRASFVLLKNLTSVFYENGVVAAGMSKDIDVGLKQFYILAAAVSFQEDSVESVYIDS